MSGTWYNRDLKRADSAEKIPREPHWAILQTGTYYESSGYEGDSGGTHNKLDYFWTQDEKAWKEALVSLYTEKPDRKDVIAFRAAPVKPQIEIKIEVK